MDVAPLKKTLQATTLRWILVVSSGFSCLIGAAITEAAPQSSYELKLALGLWTFSSMLICFSGFLMEKDGRNSACCIVSPVCLLHLLTLVSTACYLTSPSAIAYIVVGSLIAHVLPFVWLAYVLVSE